MERRRDRHKSPEFNNFYTPQNAAFYSRFHYVPVNAAEQEIRLLKIDLSGQGRHAMVNKVPLYSAANYSAVSYYSGDPTCTAPIFVDGVAFNAFQNLSTAIDNVVSFWQARHPDVPLFLWADQICINQSDTAEKSQQVAFMREVYRRAEQVFVSMPVQENVDPALAWLQRQSGYTSLPSMLRPSAEDKDPEDPARPAHVWDTMCDLIDHDWWTRSWVYQEFMVAPRIYFLFSPSSGIEWDRLAPLLLTFLSLSLQKHIQACQRHSQDARRIDEARQSWQHILDDRMGPFDPDKGEYSPCQVYKDLDDDDDDFFTVIIIIIMTIVYPVPYLVCLLGRTLFSLFCFCLACLGCPACLPCSYLLREPADVPAMERHIRRLQTRGNTRTRVDYVVRSKMLWHGTEMDLSELLRHARNTRTSNPKDKIYSFLGLARPGYDIEINYEPSHTINAVLVDTARAILQTEEAGSDILLDAGTAAVSRRLTSAGDLLPSWVPDWLTEEDPHRQEFLQALSLPMEGCAGGPDKCHPLFQLDSAANWHRVLLLAGSLVDVLRAPLAETYERWRQFHTVSGTYTVLTASAAQRGDEVWVFHGVKWPFVLRKPHKHSDDRVLLSVAVVLEGDELSPIMFGKDIEKRSSHMARII